MATFKAVINKDQVKEDKTWRVKIRVTHQRSLKYISTEHYVTKKQLTKDFEIKDPEVLDELNDTIRAYRKKITALSTAVDNYSCAELKEFLLKEETRRIDFISFTKSFIDKIPVKGTRDNATTTLNSFIDYAGKAIDINDMSLNTLNKYEDFLRSARTVSRRNNLGNTITLKLKPQTNTGVKDYLTKIKYFYTEAMLHYNDRGKVLIPYNPFDRYEMPHPEPTKSRTLSIDAMKLIRDCPDIEVGKYSRVIRSTLSRDAFMLSFYLIGMNAVDLFYADSYADGRISYSRVKTSGRRKDRAYISIKVEREVLPLLAKYKDKTGKRIFCFYQMYSDHDGFTAALNTGLKSVAKKLSIDPELTFYYARYTWANLARNICRIPKDDVAMAINHADNEHKTTDIYLDKNWKIIDDANLQVLALLRPRVNDEEALDRYLQDHPDVFDDAFDSGE